MSWHPTEEELVQFAFRDDDNASAMRIAVHLPVCPACRTTYDAIAGVLGAADAASVPDPGEAFEQRLWARVARELGPAAPPERVRYPIPARALALAAGLTLAVASVVSIALPSGSDRTTGVPAQAAPIETRERVLFTALDQHFAQTEELLVHLLNTPANSGTALAVERAAAQNLVASGRLFRETARQTGETQVTQVLDDLEVVLVEVARSPDHFLPNELQVLRSQIDQHGLLVKVRIVGDRVRERSQTFGLRRVNND